MKTLRILALLITCLFVLAACVEDDIADGAATGSDALLDRGGEAADDKAEDDASDEARRPGAPYDPCQSLVCGDYCSHCPPWEPDCVEPAVVNYCQADGSCSPQQPLCEIVDPEPEPYDPCERLTCGDYCSQCPPDEPDCVEPAVINYCQADGSCHPQQPLCLGAEIGDDSEEEPYEPCGGLSCGASCTLCPPNSLDCFETMELKYCTDDGQCVGGTPVCSM